MFLYSTFFKVKLYSVFKMISMLQKILKGKKYKLSDFLNNILGLITKRRYIHFLCMIGVSGIALHSSTIDKFSDLVSILC